MKGLNGTFQRSYKKRDKNNNLVDVFVYTVTGSKEAIEEYAKAQGEFLRTEEATGKHLWFSTRYVGDSAKLIITEKGNVVADMSEFAKAASLASQFGGNLGVELARNAAAQLMGTSSAPSAVAQPAVTEANPSGLGEA